MQTPFRHLKLFFRIDESLLSRSWCMCASCASQWLRSFFEMQNILDTRAWKLIKNGKYVYYCTRRCSKNFQVIIETVNTELTRFNSGECSTVGSESKNVQCSKKHFFTYKIRNQITQHKNGSQKHRKEKNFSTRVIFLGGLINLWKQLNFWCEHSPFVRII